MKAKTKFIKNQLALLRPLFLGVSLETARFGQDKIGELLKYTRRREVTLEFKNFSNFKAAWITPNDQTRDGVILYLHGGGYTCGSLDYSLGFGSVLASECGMKVFCISYRLAPENPYPAALEDALQAYNYLLSEGIRHDRIVLCGESAGGGMIYSLCLMLKERNIPCPSGVIGISPWTDLTASSPSYEENKDKDPSMTRERLSYFADCYTQDRANPLVSPLFANLEGLPPSLILAGGDEIMLGDSTEMHARLTAAGVDSTIHIKEGMWHGYVLFCLKENRDDFSHINAFLKKILPFERKLRWMRLDNAAKIYPAARRRNWSNVFRLSMSLKEDIDRIVLQSALDVTARRFPSISVRLKRGLFWYYLEEMPCAVGISDEKCHPISRMSKREIKEGALRVITHKNRIAVEYFHALTDGTGGMMFLKSLVAEYLTQKYGTKIPAADGVLDRLEEPSECELEDSFLKNTADFAKSRRESVAYKIPGERERGNYSHYTTFMIDSSSALAKAKERGVTLTAYMCAAEMKALCNIQAANVKNPARYKPIKVLIPVNLRPIFKSNTLRNFALYVTPEINQKLGEWSFDEICESVHHQMKMLITEKEMRARITTNVNSEKSLLLKVVPLFVKNAAMKLVFNMVGERTCCLTLSNLGDVKLPDEMKKTVERVDFILGAPSASPVNSGMLSYNGTLYFSFNRRSVEPVFEYELYKVLREEGLEITVESNLSSLPQNNL